MMIDQALEQKPADFDTLLKLLEGMGCEVSHRGQSYSLKAPGWDNAARMSKKLGKGTVKQSFVRFWPEKRNILPQRQRPSRSRNRL